MKVFDFEGQGEYGNGIALVAANSAEEAYDTLLNDPSQEYDVEMFDEDGEMVFDEKECVEKRHRYYDIEHCSEIKELYGDYSYPQIIVERSYYE